MDISSLGGIAPGYVSEMLNRSAGSESKENFGSVLSAAMNMLSETNTLQNDASAETMKFVLGEADNPHDMQIAGQKALAALQYTTAVKNKMIEAYKEIMNMQI